MRIQFVIDTEGWAFDQVARGLGRALKRRGHEFVANKPDYLHLSVDETLVGFAGLLNHPTMSAIRDEDLCVGLMSHWEMRTKEFRSNIQRMRRAKEVYAGCASIAASAANLLEREVLCIPGGIDKDVYLPARQSRARKRLIAGWSGNAEVTSKRFEMAVEACKRARVPLQTVGLGAGMRALPLDAMPEWLRGLSVYLCTSSEDCGPSGPLEAAACGVPTISTMCGFMPELIKHGKSGWICHTVDQFVEQLEKLKAEPHLAAEAGVRARRRVDTTWSWDQRCIPYLIMLGEMAGKVDTYYPGDDQERWSDRAYFWGVDEAREIHA